LKFLQSKKLLATIGAGVLLVLALAYYLFLPVAEVAEVQRGTAIAAVYGTLNRSQPAAPRSGAW
jgi:hypothetical protein